MSIKYLASSTHSNSEIKRELGYVKLHSTRHSFTASFLFIFIHLIKKFDIPDCLKKTNNKNAKVKCWVMSKCKLIWNPRKTIHSWTLLHFKASHTQLQSHWYSVVNLHLCQLLFISSGISCYKTIIPGFKINISSITNR